MSQRLRYGRGFRQTGYTVAAITLASFSGTSQRPVTACALDEAETAAAWKHIVHGDDFASQEVAELIEKAARSD